MINVIIKFDILIFSRILCGNNFVIPFSLLQIYIYIPRDFQIEKQNRVPSFKKEHLRKCGGGVCRLTGVRWNSPVHHRYGKSRNRYCLSARRLNRNFRLFIATHARTHAHRVVSNDLTSEVGGGGGNCCSNEPETGNGFARGVPMKSARRGKSNVYRLDAAKPRRKWFPVGCLPAGHRYCFVNIIIGRVERRSNGKSMRVISFYGGREKKKLNK